MSKNNRPESVSSLVGRVSTMLKTPPSEESRFQAMDLCADIMNCADVTYDLAMIDTFRSWIGKVQRAHNC